jgi:hypothetical protein
MTAFQFKNAKFLALTRIDFRISSCTIVTQCLHSFTGPARTKAALALAEGQSQQTVAEAIGVCRKTICNWLCVREFGAEIDRLSIMIGIASRAERLRVAMRGEADSSH